MIQRVQSVYFLLAGLFQLIFSFSELFVFELSGILHYQKVIGLYNKAHELISQDYKTLVLCLGNTILIWATIFLFKNPQKQIKFSKLFVLIGIVEVTFLSITYFQIKSNPIINDLTISYSLVFLPISLIFAILGYRGVKKDYDLIKSVDRIR